MPGQSRARWSAPIGYAALSKISRGPDEARQSRFAAGETNAKTKGTQGPLRPGQAPRQAGTTRAKHMAGDGAARAFEERQTQASVCRTPPGPSRTRRNSPIDRARLAENLSGSAGAPQSRLLRVAACGTDISRRKSVGSSPPVWGIAGRRCRPHADALPLRRALTQAQQPAEALARSQERTAGRGDLRSEERACDACTIRSSEGACRSLGVPSACGGPWSVRTTLPAASGQKALRREPTLRK